MILQSNNTLVIVQYIQTQLNKIIVIKGNRNILRVFLFRY